MNEKCELVLYKHFMSSKHSFPKNVQMYILYRTYAYTTLDKTAMSNKTLTKHWLQHTQTHSIYTAISILSQFSFCLSHILSLLLSASCTFHLISSLSPPSLSLFDSFRHFYFNIILFRFFFFCFSFSSHTLTRSKYVCFFSYMNFGVKNDFFSLIYISIS